MNGEFSFSQWTLKNSTVVFYFPLKNRKEKRKENKIKNAAAINQNQSLSFLSPLSFSLSAHQFELLGSNKTIQAIWFQSHPILTADLEREFPPPEYYLINSSTSVGGCLVGKIEDLDRFREIRWWVFDSLRLVKRVFCFC